jgi:hypothetical protein
MKPLTLGETRRIGIELYSIFGSDFEIDFAEYAVFNSVQEIIKTGICRIEDKKITMLFIADEIGLFNVVFTIHIKDETLKAKILTRVVK